MSKRPYYYIPETGGVLGEFEPVPTFTVDAPHPIPFHIGQVYEDTPAVQQACAHCGSIVFHLGEGSYFTALRCANCGREWCQHEG